MKEIYCTQHACICDLGQWFSRIDWELLDQQIKTLSKIEEKAHREGEAGAYGELEKADHLLGLCNMVRALRDMKSELQAEARPQDVDPFVCPYCGDDENTYPEEEKNQTEYFGCRVCGGTWKSAFEENRVYGPIEEVDPPKRPVQKGAPDA